MTKAKAKAKPAKKKRAKVVRKKRITNSAEMRELGSLGGKATVERHGVEHYRDAGKRGGAVVKERYGVEHFAELGRRGGARLRELAAKGRRSEGVA